MADKKISALTGASTPLAGTEVLPIVQSGATVKVAVSDLTAGRNVSMLTAAVGATLAGWSVFDKVTQSGAGSTANYNNEDNTLVGSNVYYGGSPANFRYISDGTATLLRQDGGNQYFLNAVSGTAGQVATLAETFRTASTGNATINNIVDKPNIVSCRTANNCFVPRICNLARINNTAYMYINSFNVCAASSSTAQINNTLRQSIVCNS